MMETDTDIEINNRHKAALHALFASGRPTLADEMKLREAQRLEWVAVTAERHKAESAAEREEAKALAATRLPKGTPVLNTVTGVRGNIASVGKHDYKVVRPGGTYVKGPHEQWEEMK